MVQWLSNTNWTKDMECHDCVLGTQKTLLDSPFDFTEEFAEEFASLTSSCGSTQYGYTTPGPYALGTQTSDAPLPTPTCTNSYVVKGTDTCNSISTAYNVSTYSITSRNNMYSDCSNLPPLGLFAFLSSATSIRSSQITLAIASFKRMVMASAALSFWPGTRTSTPCVRTWVLFVKHSFNSGM